MGAAAEVQRRRDFDHLLNGNDSLELFKEALPNPLFAQMKDRRKGVLLVRQGSIDIHGSEWEEV